jgi:hypothetical protein
MDLNILGGVRTKRENLAEPTANLDSKYFRYGDRILSVKCHIPISKAPRRIGTEVATRDPRAGVPATHPLAWRHSYTPVATSWFLASLSALTSVGAVACCDYLASSLFF